MKNILFITAFVPDRIGAGENFSRQLINDISVGNRVDLIFFKYSFNNDYVIESSNVKVLRVFRNSSLIKFLNYFMFPFIFPLFIVRFNICRLLYIKKIIRRNNYDLAIFDFSQTFIYAKFIYDIPVILNCHDVIAQRYSRIYKGFFTPFVRISEKYIMKNERAKIFNLCEKDSILLEKLYSLRSEVTSIFLDPAVIDSKPTSVENYFVFFANWSRPDNSEGLKWFIKNVYPSIEKGSIFKIIGFGLSESILSEIKSSIDFEYVGFVSDPYPIISNAKALISPLFTGAGIKVKVLESLACGTKVIGTEISFEGISEKYYRFLIPAKNVHEFISAISQNKADLSDKIELKNIFLNSYINNTISKYVSS